MLWGRWKSVIETLEIHCNISLVVGFWGGKRRRLSSILEKASREGRKAWTIISRKSTWVLFLISIQRPFPEQLHGYSPGSGEQLFQGEFKLAVRQETH